MAAPNWVQSQTGRPPRHGPPQRSAHTTSTLEVTERIRSGRIRFAPGSSRWASIARISESAPPVRQELLEDRLDAPATVDHVRMTRIELSPGQAAGRHRHPCPVFGCVLAGRIRFQLTGGPETILETGQAFHEPTGVEVPHFDNASDDEAAVFIACYLLPPGEDRVIEMLDQ